MTHVTNVLNLYSLYYINPYFYDDSTLFWLSTEKKWAFLDKWYTVIESLNGINSQWTGYYPPNWTDNDTRGGWFYDADSITFSENPPYGDAVENSQWVWLENNAQEEYDSVITYIFKKTMIDWNSYSLSWVELNARTRIHNDTPGEVYRYPNSPREKWLDTSTGIIYNSFNGGWVSSGGVSG